MNRGEYEREVYDHERQTGQHAEPEAAPEPVTLQTYSLELIGPPRHYPDGTLIGAGVMRSALDEVEENLNDLLPDGYSVRIREWDEEEK